MVPGSDPRLHEAKIVRLEEVCLNGRPPDCSVVESARLTLKIQMCLVHCFFDLAPKSKSGRNST